MHQNMLENSNNINQQQQSQNIVHDRSRLGGQSPVTHPGCAVLWIVVEDVVAVQEVGGHEHSVPK